MISVKPRIPDATLYFMFMGCGFLWTVNSFDLMRGRTCYFCLRLYWRNATNPKREWACYGTDDTGICWREKSKTRSGEWVLRGPWEKIA